MSERTMRVGNLREIVEKTADDICAEFADFMSGTRYVALLHRAKEGGDQKSDYHRRGAFFITHSPEEYRDAVARVLTLQAIAAKPYRVYASVNPRDIRKAEKKFKMDMLEADFSEGQNKRFFYERFVSKWVGALMAPGARSG